MVYQQRVALAGLIASVVTLGGYVIVVLALAGGGDLTAVPWFPVMLGAIAVGIVLSILISIAWGMIAKARDPEVSTASDVRDHDIGIMGGRVEQAFVAIGGIGVIVLCAFGAHVFWIANCMFAAFAVATFVGGIARLLAYRIGLA
ncbi:MAG: hypothetical protein ACTH31_07280 [Pseudoclavibacter sp.]